VKYPLKILIHFAKLKVIEFINPGIFISENNIDEDPIRQFDKWYKQAIHAYVTFYDAMTLSTVDKEGKPSARLVLLKSYDEKGFVFYTNSTSRKGKELSENPYASLTFFWSKKGKQVRIEGIVEKITDKESDEYFATRPRGSQLGAWASEQSSVITDRKTLIEKVEELDKQYKGKAIPRPPYWLGYRLVPERIEFWQNRINRLHDRFAYTLLENKAWKHERLSP
jgi:pyridoxamine 5'-phosphate oxidase